jgi:hypothetical protein
MSPTLIDLEDMLLEKLREGRANDESFQFTLLKALQDVVPSPNQPEYLAMLYAASPYTLDQFDEGGKVSELLYHNIRRHLLDYAKHWLEVKNKPVTLSELCDDESNVIHPTEWR